MHQHKRKPYDTDVSDAEWKIIAPLIPPPRPGGRTRTTDTREVINALFYLLKSGCPWRLLPNDFPHWRTVYDYFHIWKKNGTWKTIHDVPRDKVRMKAGKKKQPTAGIIDSQSVKTVKKGGLVAMMLVKK